MELLAALEAIHQHWLNRYGQDGWFCATGCGSCCTQSVTITAIEGRRILSHLAADGRHWTTSSGPNQSGTASLTLTTNQLARLCLDGIEPPEPTQNPWDLTPCPFLEEGRCSIYPARPFMCRAFVSRNDCAQAGEALVEPVVVTATTVFLQLIEHLGQGEVWGTLGQVLDHLSVTADQTTTLAQAEPLPGFLIPPEEQRTLDGFFNALSHTQVRGKSVWQWLQEGGYRGL